VVGAGYAGMAAAVTLASNGVPVTVFEAGPVPGGRARRVSIDGRELDNGQHILIGAYGELLRLMHEVGVPSDALLRVPLELRYADGFSFRALWLPAPLGLLGGLLTCGRLPFGERLKAIGFMQALKKSSFTVPDDINVRDLLDLHGQNGVIGHYLWRPLCVSALNTPPEMASGQVFANVLRDSLGGASEASDLLLPRVDLSKLFPEPACDFVRARGGEILLNETVRDVEALKQQFAGVIVAVAPHRLASLIPWAAMEFEHQPIYTCYLQYRPEVRLPFPMLGFSKGVVQWAFDRGGLTGERGLFACVISAQGDHQQLSRKEIADTCHRELANAVPGLSAPEWSQVIAEKLATLACTGHGRYFSADTPLNGVHFAGDYTYPHYPPTLESAVRSGVLAAKTLMENH
jgi:squalene-associated FAD-dependent desaturase